MTLPDHIRALCGPRRRYLMPGDRNIAKLLRLYVLRAALFNGLMVRGLWEPLVAAAERSPLLARIMTAQIYRGVLFYHFLRGCRDGYREFDRAHGVRDRTGAIPG